MAVAQGIFGIILSMAMIFIALIVFDAFQTNVIDCSTFTAGSSSADACNNTVTYVGIAFVIIPITILFDVIGLLPFFGGKFSIRN